MIRVTFSARRSLIGAHVDGDIVTLSFSTMQLTPGRKVTRDSQRALSGARETLHHSGLRTWQITTEPLSGPTLEAVLEFLDSCEGGESFMLEPWGDEFGPSLDFDFLAGPRTRLAEGVNCVLDSEGYSFGEVIQDGTGPWNGWYSLSFTAEETPP